MPRARRLHTRVQRLERMAPAHTGIRLDPAFILARTRQANERITRLRRDVTSREQCP